MSIIAPTTLHQLLVDPDDQYLDLFLDQMQQYLGRIATFDQDLHTAVGMSKEYNRFLHSVKEASRPYKVLAAMIYMLCMPFARENLCSKDTEFLDKEFQTNLGMWLNGADRNHALFTGSSCLLDAHTIAFVTQQADFYRWAYSVDFARLR